MWDGWLGGRVGLRSKKRTNGPGSTTENCAECVDNRRSCFFSYWILVMLVLFIGYLLLFITTVPIEKLFAGGRGIVEDMCYEIRRAEACVD